MSPELTRIFDELKALGVASITANYSGQGDSGQFDGITAHNADGSVLEIDLDKPVGEEIALRVKDRLLNREFKTLSNRIAQLVWDTVDAEGHSGFWNNEGGEGTLEIDVAEQTITLNHTDHPEGYWDDEEGEEETEEPA